MGDLVMVCEVFLLVLNLRKNIFGVYWEIVFIYYCFGEVQYKMGDYSEVLDLLLEV